MDNHSEEPVMSRQQYRQQQAQQASFADQPAGEQRRQTVLDQQRQTLVEEKVNRLKHRLNIAIIGLVIAIIIVYLILFFVG